MPPTSQLFAPGWSTECRERLQNLIRRGAGKHLPVVFDFDNTIMCGDIGEATLAMLVRDGILAPGIVPAHACPPFTLPSGKLISLASLSDLTDYYEALLDATPPGANDLTPMASGYVWAVEAMQGLSPLEVARATQRVFALSQPMKECLLEVTPGRSAYPIPFFYPASVELIAQLIRHEFDVWIVSASNVWSVRWMALHALNPLLQAHGLAEGIPADHVVGVATLLTDQSGSLYKDAVLVRENAAYAALEPDALESFRLTRWLQYPVPTYSGKVGAIWDGVGRRPYLCAGDSPGDHPMLAFSENRLWIARLEKPDYQAATAELVRQTGRETWSIQPVLARNVPQFVPDLGQVNHILPDMTPKIFRSLAVLEGL
jgi:hypothetical protein